MKDKYLVALPTFPNSNGFCHRTILVSAKNKNDARVLAGLLRPKDNIGDIKKVDY